MGAIYAAVNRRNVISCGPEGGWYPENCVTVYEAVSMYTSNAAYASFEENLKGTIKEGKLADFVVLDKDVFQVDPLTIRTSRSCGPTWAASWSMPETEPGPAERPVPRDFVNRSPPPRAPDPAAGEFRCPGPGFACGSM